MTKEKEPGRRKFFRDIRDYSIGFAGIGGAITVASTVIASPFLAGEYFHWRKGMRELEEASELLFENGETGMKRVHVSFDNRDFFDIGYDPVPFRHRMLEMTRESGDFPYDKALVNSISFEPSKEYPFKPSTARSQTLYTINREGEKIKIIRKWWNLNDITKTIFDDPDSVRIHTERVGKFNPGDLPGYLAFINYCVDCSERGALDRKFKVDMNYKEPIVLLHA